VGQILWSEAAAGAMRRLGPALRAAIQQRAGYLEQMPRMYARVEDERFPGCRSFWVGDRCQVFYMVAAGGDDCYLVAVEEAEPLEEPGSAGESLFGHEL
jgi:hypothetical protein